MKEIGVFLRPSKGVKVGDLDLLAWLNIEPGRTNVPRFTELIFTMLCVLIRWAILGLYIEFVGETVSGVR